MPVTPIPRLGSLVIALHCSGAGASEWRPLAAALGPQFDLRCPEHYGCESVGPWPGEGPFTLADEVKRTLDLIDDCDRPVHLVGHSYGGGVALRAALERPGRVASISLYEPSAFHLLRLLDGPARAAFAEIDALARRTADDIGRGDHRGAAAFFVEYWGGKGAWEALRPAAQQALARWAPKAPLDFAALIDEQTPLSAYAELCMPALVLRGEHALTPSRLIAEAVSTVLPAARLTIVDGAGHMGPLTHAGLVCAAIASHIVKTESALRNHGQPWLLAGTEVSDHGLRRDARAVS